MPAVLEFLVDSDEAAPKRIVVRPLTAGQYSLDVFTQNDERWRRDPREIEITGKPLLAQRLIDEGVPEDTVYADLSLEPPQPRGTLAVLFASLIMWLVLGVAGFALARWLWGVLG